MEEKNKKRKWDQKSLKTAIGKILSKELSLRVASLRYNIPKSTLHDKISALKRGEEVTLQPKIGRFTPEYEQVLVNHVKDLSNRCLPLTKKEFLKLAFDLAESMKIPHRFNKDKGIAGKHFYYDFMRRHPDLSLRTPESTSMMRAVGFNKPQVDLYYDNLEKLLTQYKFSPANIYNCDETGVSCVHKHPKVLAPKALRQVGKLTSAERGKNITILFCMSAVGHFIPPFFVFPRQRMNDRLMINAPAGSVGVAQPKGWMNCDFFLQWLQLLFVKHSHPTKDNPVLLLVDGHRSHKTLAVINFCRDNNIHLISLPPHTTHKLQPLDRTFMKPFKDAFNQRCDVWMRANAGSRITDYDIAGLVREAFTKVARLDIATSGFKCTGIYPFDRHLFSDLDYLAADMTNIPLEEPGTSSNTLGCSGEVSVSVKDPPEESTNEPRISNARPSTSLNPDVIETVHKFSPLPDAAKKRSAARKKKCERSEILTSTPYKIAVEEKGNEKNAKEEKKRMKTKSKIKKEENGKQTKVVKAKGRSEEKSKQTKGVKAKGRSEEKGKQTKGVKAKGKNGDKAKKKQALNEMSEVERTICVVCLEDYDEDWIQCSSCHGWAHEACAAIPESSDDYICDRCRMF